MQALRDGIPGIAYTPARATELVGKECGNGVVIAHDQSWETQYCHLKQGSISVKVGNTVQVGDVFGKNRAVRSDTISTRSYFCVPQWNPY